MFFGRNGVKTETPVLWPPHEKSRLIGKNSDAGRDWGHEEKGTIQDVMAGWHHGLDGCESERTPGDGDRQGGLACCDSWGRKELDTTEWLNWTELNLILNLQAKWHTQRCHDISKALWKDQGMGGSPIAGMILLLISIWNYPAHKKLTTPHSMAFVLTFYRVCFSLNLNKANS